MIIHPERLCATVSLPCSLLEGYCVNGPCPVEDHAVGRNTLPSNKGEGLIAGPSLLSHIVTVTTSASYNKARIFYIYERTVDRAHRKNAPPNGGNGARSIIFVACTKGQLHKPTGPRLGGW